jgi:hypothetical protein
MCMLRVAEVLLSPPWSPTTPSHAAVLKQVLCHY